MQLVNIDSGVSGKNFIWYFLNYANEQFETKFLLIERKKVYQNYLLTQV